MPCGQINERFIEVNEVASVEADGNRLEKYEILDELWGYSDAEDGISTMLANDDVWFWREKATGKDKLFF